MILEGKLGHRSFPSVTCSGNSPRWEKVRRGNYVFVTWWNLDDRLPMKGKATARLRQLIAELQAEGAL